MNHHSKFHPKPRTGKECKKANCKRYQSYSKWALGSADLKFCMECRNAHASQYDSKLEAATDE